MGSLGYALSTVATVPLLPVLVAQGRYVRKNTPQLPGAAGPDRGVVGEGAPLELLVLGESTVAGVGVDSHELALTGQAALALASAARRAVHWRAVGEPGITARTAVTTLLPRLGSDAFDVAVIALGVNDTKQLRSPTTWTRDVTALVSALREKLGGPVPVLLSSIPPLSRFPALPQPLRGILGARSSALDAALKSLAARLPRTRHLEVVVPAGDHWFCADRFHPSAAGYAFWGNALGPVLAELASAP